MKIILAFDSFKGSLTAVQAVEAAREGILSAMPYAEVVGLPLADGGEGTVEALVRFMQAEWRTCIVHDPLMRPIQAQYAVSADGSTAIMEMAQAAGLTLLAEDERNPMLTTTYGVGEMMKEAVAAGCTRVVLGIGGSATNDGGMGVLAALGIHFLDVEGNELQPIGANLYRIAAVVLPRKPFACEVTVVCDVENPLFGPNGAAYVYAAQKGADKRSIELLDQGLSHFASMCGFNPAMPGSGAAGGLGYGLQLIGACLRRGVDVVLQAADFDTHLQGADLVITGEGRIDCQTLCGKLPFGVLRRARAHGVPVYAYAGAVADVAQLLTAGFSSVQAITPSGQLPSEYMRTEVAYRNMRNAMHLLRF